MSEVKRFIATVSILGAGAALASSCRKCAMCGSGVAPTSRFISSSTCRIRLDSAFDELGMSADLGGGSSLVEMAGLALAWEDAEGALGSCVVGGGTPAATTRGGEADMAKYATGAALGAPDPDCAVDDDAPSGPFLVLKSQDASGCADRIEMVDDGPASPLSVLVAAEFSNPTILTWTSS
eukprot:scaffold7513_cov112-Isochrysis_galbana.AAC.1